MITVLIRINQNDKINICNKYLLPSIYKRLGMPNSVIQISDDVLVVDI